MHRPPLRPPRISTLAFGFALVLATLATKGGGSEFESGFSDFSASGTHSWNGVPGGQQIDGAQGMTALQAMLWKYTARCALPAGQELEAPPDATTGKRPKFPGFFGMAPEWRNGTCDRACQEKVSSCLIALTNRTGKHVLISVLSGDSAMGKKFLPEESDRAFPHQEGVFFGNVFSNEAYACQGRDVGKGPQVKRFCALEPATCSGLSQFVDAGRCQDVCQMSCSRLSDKSERCVAVSCQDPKGVRWNHPVTTYLRNKIEAANADAATGVRISDEQIDSLDGGDSVTFKQVDFGRGNPAFGTFAAELVSRRSRGHIEIWLDGGRRIGVLDVKATGQAQGEQTTAIQGAPITGTHDVTLKIVGAKDIGRLSTFEFR